MTPQAIARWERARARGRLRYVLVSGVLAYGLPMFVIMTFLVHRDDLSPAFVAISAVLWLLGGAVFGVTMWYFLERQYRKAVGRNGA